MQMPPKTPSGFSNQFQQAFPSQNPSSSKSSKQYKPREGVAETRLNKEMDMLLKNTLENENYFQDHHIVKVMNLKSNVLLWRATIEGLPG